MNLKSILCFATLLFYFGAISQNLVFTKQKEIDNFKQNSFQRLIDGNIQIGIDSNTITDITNLDSLEHIEEILGDLNISYNSKLVSIKGLRNLRKVNNLEINNNLILPNMSGLENLKKVRKNVYIYKNSALINLLGLSSIDTCDILDITGNDQLKSFNGIKQNMKVGLLNVYSNKNLTTLDGLSALNAKNAEVYISFNPSLISLDGILGVDEVNFLEISNNPKLKTLRGLESLKRIGIRMRILQNDSLETLDGLQNLKVINAKKIIKYAFANGGGHLSIGSNKSLLHLNALENLTELNGAFNIFGNKVLKSINGLRNIDPNFFSKKYDDQNTISSNPNLTNCEITPICFLLNNTTIKESFSKNGQDCNLNDINCNNYSLSGKIYFDTNRNNQIDAGDVGVKGVKIADGSNTTYFSDQNGNYTIFVVNGQQITFNIIDNDINWKIISPAIGYEITFDSSKINNKYDFLISSVFNNAEINISSGPTRCYEEVPFFIDYVYSGTELNQNLKIKFEIDEKTKFISAFPIPSEVTPQYVSWNISDVKPYSNNQLKVNLKMPDENQTGKDLRFETSISLDSLGNIRPLRSYKYESIVRCSYDPNDKQVNPIGIFEKKYIQKDEVLNYTIRFQNEGNDYARQVKIQDRLDYNFDLTSLKMLNSSHNCSVSISDGMVTFLFSEIWLPTKAKDPRGSQGFVTFSLKALNTIPDKTSVANKAEIYFDYNAPILTNNVENTLVKILPKSDRITCGTDGLLFKNQKEVDLFPYEYPYCKTIEGNLCIGYCTVLNTQISSDIVDLKPLSNLSSINGSLTISTNKALNSLEGLHYLTNVSEMDISQNENLISLNGLQKIKNIPKNVTIFNNSNLSSYLGLDNINEIGGRMLLIGNGEVKNLEHLQNLKTIKEGLNIVGHNTLKSLEGLNFNKCKEIRIIDNEGLVNLMGLSILTDFVEDLEIFDNKNIATFDGLENLRKVSTLIFSSNVSDISALKNLKSVEKMLIIRNASKLTNLDAFDKLEKLGGLSITNNALLSDLNGLKNIKNKVEYFILSENPNLSNCSIDPICAILDIPDLETKEISKNGDNCTSNEEVIRLCNTTISSITEINSSDIKIIPNPNNGLFHINLYGKTLENTSTITLKDPCGQNILAFDMLQTAFDVSFLNKGLYFLEIKVKEQIVRKKVIIN